MEKNKWIKLLRRYKRFCVKFPVEYKSELRRRLQNKGKPSNGKKREKLGFGGYSRCEKRFW